ncbi:MAG: hypothetical protein V4864_05600 [Pseudomonadota bacterium]
MKLAYVAIGAFVALFPMASFVLIALEVVMVFQIAKKHNAVHLGDIIWFCSVMVVVSLVLKFIAAWLHFIPLLGQIANSLVAAAFIYFTYEVADAHYAKVAAGK